MRSQGRLYDEVVIVTEQYFGPAADRFVKRQILNHLNKDPEELERQDLKGLIRWLTLAVALLVEDERLIKNFAADLEGLVTKRNRVKASK